MKPSAALGPPADPELLQLAASYAPRYVRLYITLKERLLRGDAGDDDLRSDRLVAEFGVSKSTVTGALQLLAGERMIIRRRGRAPKVRRRSPSWQAG